jgi:L-galactose dehydrogenase
MVRTLERRPYGSTGQEVTVIGLGGGSLAKHSLDEGVATVRRALELGINYFDTSPAYGAGASQVIVGKALEGRTEPYILATKLGYLATPREFRSPDALRAQLWENLRALRRNQVDVLQVHIAELACWWKDDAEPGELLSTDQRYDFDGAPVMQVLREAREQGLCRFIGITADKADELAHVLRDVEVDACLSAYHYNLLFRRAIQTVMPLARQKGIAFVDAAILKPAFTEVHPEWLATPPDWMTPEIRDGLTRLYEIQRQSGLSMVNLAVRYPLSNRGIATLLVGAATPAELEECIEAARYGPLSQDLHQSIEELGLS